MTTVQQTPYLNTREDSAFRFLGIPTLMRATGETTNGSFALLEQWEVPPGFGSPYHTHHHEDESFYVLEGQIAFVVDGKWSKAGPGTFVYGPRDIAHGFKVIGNSPARMVLMCNPAGFEGFVLAQQTPIAEPPSPPDMGKLMMLAAQYGIDIHGPLPESPAEFDSDGPAEDLKSLNRRWIEAFNERDWKTERAVRSDDFQARLSGVKEPLNGAAWEGFLGSFIAAFPDGRIRIESCIAEGEKVVAGWTLAGTHLGEFQGIPASGRVVKIAGIEINHVKDRKIAKHECCFDILALLEQIGAR
ncbi:MAG TPA: ester cyclase [Bryobacteraceae bacterium]|jgi:steroid delta-isomerase-like uncharacterized protein